MYSNALKRKIFSAIISFFLGIIFSTSSFSQHYTRTDTIPVKINNVLLKMPWVGGHNFCQFSDIDMNFDGIKDLFVFDRTGIKITTYINKGTANTVDYLDSTSKYAPKFPHLEDWALLRDYNCDGKTDIFTYANGGITVYKNTSSGGNLQFTLQSSYLKSTYCPALLNLGVTSVDIPTIDDIDGDGDLDILTYDAGGINMQYHVNKSKELGYNCDSLLFSMDCSGCWGNFRASISGCNMVYGTCIAPGPDSSNYERSNELHAGNCSLCLDLDADGDKDILLGQLGCCNITQLTNGGSASVANMTAMDDSFPSYDVPAMFTSFPCGYFLDLNNDNKRDLIVSPNAPNVSIDKESVWYYLNTGTDNAPVFKRQTRALFQNEMIDAGEGADPVFFDFNSDGLKDLLVSNYTAVVDSCPPSNIYGVLAFQNTGTLTSPKFEQVSNDFANLSSTLSSITSKHLTFGDLDADGDADMCVGDFDGFVHYFKNIATTGNPATFSYTGLLNDVTLAAAIDIGSYSTPQLIDADRDGDLDLIIGERAGNLNYYKNSGTASSYSFSLTTSSFGGVDVMKPCCTGYSVPFMYDSLGSYRLLVGSEAIRSYNNTTGWIWKYSNIDGNLAGSFSLEDSLYKKIWEGSRMSVNGADINNDASMDLVIGNYSGGVAIYLGDTGTVAVSELEQATFNYTIYPNPAKGQIHISLNALNQNQIFDLSIYNVLGEKVFASHVNAHNPNFTVETTFLSGGIYSCELKIAGTEGNAKNRTSISKKVVLVK